MLKESVAAGPSKQAGALRFGVEAGAQVARNDHSIFRMPGFDSAPLLG